MKTVTIKALNPRNADTKYMGEEPRWIEQPSDNRFSAMTKAFTWYSYFYGKKEAKDFVAEYLDRRDRQRDAKRVRSLPDSAVKTTLGWLCRMTDMGLQLLESEQKTMDTMLSELLAVTAANKTSLTNLTDQTPKTNIQDRLRDRVSECMGELEGQFDDFVIAGVKLSADFKPVSTMRTMNIAPQMVNVIKDSWTGKLAEFQEVLEGRDADLVEAYSHLTKNQIKQCVKFCELVIADCGAYVQIKKVERKPRKIKPVSPEKRSAKFKILSEFAELKLKSLPAASLVDKSEAWLYDTKKRKLIHVVADEYTKVFTVKNNSVIGFSTTESLQKTVRKPGEIVKAVVSSGKPAARKVFKDLTTTETQWNGRGTDSLIILKAW